MKAKEQTIYEMVQAGATHDEALHAAVLITILRPCLKLKSNGRYDTNGGDKTALGLFRTVKELFDTYKH